MKSRIVRLLRSAGLLVLAAAVAAAILTTLWEQGGGEDFEKASARAAASLEARAGGVCQLSEGMIEREDIALVSICAAYGLPAYVAAKKYPDIAPELFVLYGEVPEFRKILDQYGPVVLPVVQFFRDNGSASMRTKVGITSAWRNFWGSIERREPIDAQKLVELPKLSRDEYGFIAVQEIHRSGHRLLSEFEYVNGVSRKWTPRVTNFAYDVFVGGISDLEAAMVRGEKPTWKQIGWATLDAAVILGGAGAVVKSIRTAKVAGTAVTTTTTATRVSTIGTKTLAAVRVVGTVGKTAGKAILVASPFAVGYVAVTRPGLIMSAGAWVAEQAGVPDWVGAYGAMFLVIFIGLILLRFAWLVVRPAVAPFAFLVVQGTRWAAKAT